jgi:hypothetical protein
MNSPTRISNPLKLAQVLLYVNAALWIIAGVYTLWRMSVGGALDGMGAIFVGMLLFGNAFLLALAAVGLGERARLTFLFAFLVLFVNSLLTLADQLGWIDLLTLALNLLTLALLVVYRKQLGM